MDIVMRRRSICRRRTKSVVVTVTVTDGEDMAFLGIELHLPNRCPGEELIDIIL